MKVLLIGSGGREHALAWKLAQSPQVTSILVAPGNAGTARADKCTNIAIAATEAAQLIRLAQAEHIDLTVVGPEAPLVNGIVDQFQAAGLRIFGPTAAAAQLEGSKAFAKAFMARHGIPTAAFRVHTCIETAMADLQQRGVPLVIKDDGLAAGKGVTVATCWSQAEAAIRRCFTADPGSNQARVVIEDCLCGEEASFIVLVDGKTALPLATSQDHKRVGDGDTGPNTGGMGAYSPAPVVTAPIHARIMERIIQPTIAGMSAEGHPFNGFLYAGVMITPAGDPQVIEFNVRLGDPEAQALLVRLHTDLIALIDAALDQNLLRQPLVWDHRPAVTVVMASSPYPQTPVSGETIAGWDRIPPDCQIFHAGTQFNTDGTIITAGGRVLSVTSLGENFRAAQSQAYAGVDALSWEHAFSRRDIGWRAIARENGLSPPPYSPVNRDPSLGTGQ